MRPPIVAALLLGALAAAAALGTPGRAEAHATLQASTPQRGTTVAHPPAQVVLRFDEAVEGSFGAVRVFDVDGARVDQGDTVHPDGDGRALAVHLRPGLPAGTYTATYRVVSADSHVVSGGLVFSIGRPTAGGGRSVEQLLGTGSGPVTDVAFGAARATQYAALAVAGGVLVFALWIWAPALGRIGRAGEGWRGASATFARRSTTIVLAAALAGTLSALAAVVLEAAQAAGISAWSALRPRVLDEVLGTTFGRVWTAAAVAWVLLGVAAAATRPSPRGPTPAAALAPLAPLLYLCLVPALSGHGSTQGPTAVMFPANVVHVAAMTAWAGGLAALLLAVPAATRQLPLEERATLLAGLLVRFSALALSCVLVLVAAGLVQAFIEIRHLDRVLTTAFGRAVLIKSVLMVGIVGLGALHRRRLVPAIARAAQQRRSPGAGGVLLARALRAEAALVVAVLAVTGALAGYAPATAQESGPFATTTRVGPQSLELTLDPARVGANAVHLYLTDPRTGAQLDRAKEVDIAAALPAKGIGALHAEATKAGPGHYVVNGLVLGVRGDWRVTVTVRVSAFDEYATTVEVPIR